MYKRIELHNHTVESDGKMTVEELAIYFNEHGIKNFSLTDHNTISGHRKMKKFLAGSQITLDFLSGFELTSYYGHILCQNVSKYIHWEDIDKENADLLLDRVHQAEGLAGIAHPFNIGSPISNGQEFSMKLHDPSKLDFIEIINNAHPMNPDNRKAILWWEELIMRGYRISAVSGIDFHGPRTMNDFFTTYMEVPESLSADSLALQFEKAIASCKTCVTRGPIIEGHIENGILFIETKYIEDRFSDRFYSQNPLYYRVHIASEHLVIPGSKQATINLCKHLSDFNLSGHAIMIELYEGKVEWQNLVAVAAPVFLESI